MTNSDIDQSIRSSSPPAGGRGAYVAVEAIVGVVEIGVGDDSVEGVLAAPDLAAGEAACPAPPPARMRDTGLGQPQLATQSPLELRQAVRTSAPVPPRGKETPHLSLQEVDQRVDGAGLEGIPARSGGRGSQRLAQVLVLHEAGDRAVDRAIGPQARELRRDPHHVREAQERNVDQPLIPLLEDPPAVVDEGRYPATFAGSGGAICCAHRLRVAAVVEGVSVGPAQPVEGRTGSSVDVVGHARAGEREQLLQAVGGGDDGRAGVEDVKPSSW